MKYFLYRRKSTETEEKQALSLASQLDKAREMFSDLDIIEMPPESASAFTPNNRPIFEEMLRRIDAGEAQGIIAWHPDRLSRNEMDAAAITYRIRKGQIHDLKFGSYTFDNSPEGIMMLQLTMSQSQYFSSKLSKDVKRGNDRKLAMGWRPGMVPLGYLNTPDMDKGTRIVISDPERFPVVRKLWDLMLTGNYSSAEITRIARKKYGLMTKKTRNQESRLISTSGVHAMFHNVFYTGYFKHNDKLYEGKHEAMVTMAEYNRVQRLLGRKGTTRPKAYKFSYTGHITCGDCGGSVSAETKQKYIKSTAETRDYTYYHCTRKRPCGQHHSIREDVIDQQVKELLASITIIPEFRDWALKALRENNGQEAKARRSIQKSQAKAILANQKRIDNLTAMRLNELVDDEEYKKQKELLVSEKHQLEESAAETSSRADKWLELTEDVFQFATTAAERFASGDTDTRGIIFASLGNGYTLLDKELKLELHEWFVPIQKSYPKLEQQFNRVRTSETMDSKQKTAALTAVFSNWLRRLDSNQ